jgi:hypothetical protein
MDLNEIGALLHIHDALAKHGDTFQNLRKHVWGALKQAEADNPIEPDPKKEIKHPGLTGNTDLLKQEGPEAVGIVTPETTEAEKEHHDEVVDGETHDEEVHDAEVDHEEHEEVDESSVDETAPARRF